MRPAEVSEAAGRFLRQWWGTIVRVAAIAVCAAAPGCQPFLPLVAGLASAVVAGVTSGNLGYALKAGLIAFASAMIFQGIGEMAGGLGQGLAGTGGPDAWGPPMGLTGGREFTLYASSASGATQLAPIVVSGPSFAESFFQGALGLIPGLYYSGLAQQQFQAGNYLKGTAYGAATVADVVLSVAPFGIAAKVGALGVRTLEGSFSIRNWTGYPANVPQPTGPFRLLEGAEYDAARAAANQANRALHEANPALRGLHIHEIHPVKFGGSPTDPLNKISLTPGEHAPVTTWWNQLQRAIEGK